MLVDTLTAVFRRIPAALTISLILTMTLLLSLFRSRAHPPGLFWLVANLLVALAFLPVAGAYFRQPEPLSDPRHWRGYLELGAFTLGALWGVAALYLMPSGPLNALVLATILSALTGGALLLFAPVWSAYLFFLLPVTLPSSLRLLGEAALEHRMLGSMGLVYTLAMVLASARICRSMRATLTQAQDHAASNRELQAAYDTLKRYQAELETTVWARTLELHATRDQLQEERAAHPNERLRDALRP